MIAKFERESNSEPIHRSATSRTMTMNRTGDCYLDWHFEDGEDRNSIGWT